MGHVYVVAGIFDKRGRYLVIAVVRTPLVATNDQCCELAIPAISRSTPLATVGSHRRIESIRRRLAIVHRRKVRRRRTATTTSTTRVGYIGEFDGVPIATNGSYQDSSDPQARSIKICYRVVSCITIRLPRVGDKEVELEEDAGQGVVDSVPVVRETRTFESIRSVANLGLAVVLLTGEAERLEERGADSRDVPAKGTGLDLPYAGSVAGRRPGPGRMRPVLLVGQKVTTGGHWGGAEAAAAINLVV